MNKLLNRGGHNYSISLIRLISMLFIVSCHIMQWLDFELAWWFNVGVQIFLCISGYLYGQSPKKEVTSFYKSRFIKILVPYFIVFIVVAVLELVFVHSEVSIVSIGGGLFARTTIPGGEHLWFIRYILLCYIITPLLTVYRDKYVHDNKSWWLYAIILVFVTSAFFGIHVQAFNPAWMTCYAIGYVLGANKGYCKNGLLLGLFGFGAAVCNGIQIYVDYISGIIFTGIVNTIYSYYRNYSHVLLGVFLFLLMMTCFDRMHFSSNMVKVLDVADKYSYETYLVHQFFILGPFSLMALTPVIPINIILILICIMIATWLLKKLEVPIVGLMMREK